jgi:hypothetical protein
MAAEGDAFLVTRQPTTKKPSPSAPAAAAAAVAKAAAKETGPPLPALRVSSNMARFEPEYELVLKSRVESGGRASSSSSTTSSSASVEARSQLKATSFFRSDGTMDSAALQREVGALLDEIEAKAAAKSGGGGGGGGGGGSRRSSPRTKKN